jgi:sulfatase modifying factor 1
MNLQDIRNLISQGDTKSAIKALNALLAEGAFHNKRLRNDLILLSNRFEEISHKENVGLIDPSEVIRAHTQLNNAILNLIEELEVGRSPLESPSPPPARPNRFIILLGSTSIILIIVIAILWQGGFFNLQKPDPNQNNNNDLPISFAEIHERPIQDTVFVEGGLFEMGGNDEEGDDDEFPHKVTVNSFFIDRMQVTNEQYAAFLNELEEKADSNWINFDVDYKGEHCRIYSSEQGYKIQEGYDQYPVLNVSWAGAKAYASYYGMRLPTEAEWEFAARGGNEGKNNKYKYAGSNELDEVAWHLNNANLKVQPVAQLKPNELGLYDMSGNVFDWCEDNYIKEYYLDSPSDNPICKKDSPLKVLRGGNIYLPTQLCRVANRGYYDPERFSPGVGFRCVKDFIPNPKNQSQ